MHPSDEAVLTETRRQFFGRGAKGLGNLALFSLLAETAKADTAGKAAVGGLPGLPHFAPKAKSVIWLFMEGGPSHVDLFDPKPKLTELNGQPLPASFGKPVTAMGTAGNTLMASRRTLARNHEIAPHVWAASPSPQRRRRHSVGAHDEDDRTDEHR